MSKTKRRRYVRTSDCPSCPEYQSWVSMWQRCCNKKNSAYDRYGGRGITVAHRWRDFFKFVDDVGRRPKGTTLGRIRNEGNYEPGNVEWQTAQEQVENRRCTIFVTIGTATRALTYWCRRYGVGRDVVKLRYRKHGNWAKALKEAKRNLTEESMLVVTIGDQTMTARAWCKQYGIRFQKAWSRVNRDGWSWEKAITTPTVHQKDRQFKKTINVTIEGKTQSIRQWCKELGIPMGTYWKRTKVRGMTPVEALLAEKKINQYK